MNNDDFSWLDDDEQREKNLPVSTSDLDDDSDEPLPAISTTKDDLAAALDALTRKQRAFLNVFASFNFVAEHTTAALKKSGQWAPGKRTLIRWRQQPAFAHALALWKEHVLALAGVDAASVLARLNRSADFNAEPIVDQHGITRQRDAQASLGAMKLLAQHVGVARDPEPPHASGGGLAGHLTINFIHDRPRSEPIIDAQFTEVKTDGA